MTYQTYRELGIYNMEYVYQNMKLMGASETKATA